MDIKALDDPARSAGYNHDDASPLTDISRLTSRDSQCEHLIVLRQDLTTRLGHCAGPCPDLILQRARVYQALGYADLALADAYVSYTLCLVALEGADVSDLEPYYEDGRSWPDDMQDQAQSEDADEESEDEVDIPASLVATTMKYHSLIVLCRSALLLGVNFQAKTWFDESIEARSALARLATEKPTYADHDVENQNHEVENICRELCDYYTVYKKPLEFSRVLSELEQVQLDTSTHFGLARREIYPWNKHEPDRMSKESLDEINSKLKDLAPNLEARVSILPALSILTLTDEQQELVADGERPAHETSKQLGLFAKTNLPPSTKVLEDHSVLTAIRPHGEALCDACATDMEAVPADNRRYCPGCNIPFCSQTCHDLAVKQYHHPNTDDEENEEGYPPALTPFCPGQTGNDDIHTLGRAESSTTPEWDLYLILLSRAIQMSETQSLHPLDLFETKFLWGDFQPVPLPTTISISPPPLTLPFSVRHNVELPLQLFETLLHSLPDTCHPYSRTWLEKYDWWVIQTLYAKFRGVADAQQSTWTGKPEAAGVHPLWCLANHSCAPNVSWKGEGPRSLVVVEKPVWRKNGDEEEEEWKGISAGEEVWNHYTDIEERDVEIRRGRLQEVLGGTCRCERCEYESSQASKTDTEV
jgi:hypothetical protein